MLALTRGPEGHSLSSWPNEEEGQPTTSLWAKRLKSQPRQPDQCQEWAVFRFLQDEPRFDSHLGMVVSNMPD